MGWQKPLAGSDPSLLEPRVSAVENKNTSLNLMIAETAKKAVSTISHNVDKNIIVSFIDDDGDKRVMTRLKPIFESEGVPCTVGIITNKLNDPNYLNSADMNELQNMGWTVCSHTHTHANLGTLTEAEVETELSTARNLLEGLGMDGADIIVYPYGGKSDTSLKVARRHSVLGIGGYADYNIMPINTYELIRFADISENTFDLNACKTIVDNAPPNSWLIFYTHVWYDMWAQQQTVDNMHALIQYIKTKNIDIVSAREGLNRKGNIVDVGDKKKYFKIGRDGTQVSNRFTDTTVDNATPITKFPLGETKVFFNSTAITGKNFPSTSASLLTTYRIPYSEYSSQEVVSYQTFEPYTSNVTYRRKWNATTSVWNAWEVVSQPLEKAPLHYVNATKNTYSAANLITDFTDRAITTFHFDSNGSAGMPVTGGMVTTFRLGGNRYDKQECRSIDTNTLYSRTTKADGTWGAWEKYISTNDLTNWVGIVNIITAFRPIGITKCTNFVEFEKLFATSGTTPTLSKTLWAASEISTDSANPTTIGTAGAVNLQVYRDANNIVYVKYSASGNNNNVFFRTSFC